MKTKGGTKANKKWRDPLKAAIQKSSQRRTKTKDGGLEGRDPICLLSSTFHTHKQTNHNHSNPIPSLLTNNQLIFQHIFISSQSYDIIHFRHNFLDFLFGFTQKSFHTLKNSCLWAYVALLINYIIIVFLCLYIWLS